MSHKLDQSECVERLEILESQAALQGFKLPGRTGDLLADLEKYETLVPTPSQQMKTTSTVTTNTNNEPTKQLEALGQGYDRLPAESRARLMSEHGPALREEILRQERESRTNPAV